MVLDHVYPPDLRVENEVRTLVGAGFDVTVLAISPDHRPKLEEKGKARIVRDRLPAQIRNKMRGLADSIPLLDIYLWYRIRRLHSLYQIDAIHAHDLYLFGACIRIGRKLRVPVVGDMHENWPEALKHYKWSTTFPGKLVINIPRWERREMSWTSGVDQLIVVIEEMAERIGAKGIPADKITVLPNTINLDDFASWPVQSVVKVNGGPRLIYTGGMDRNRGLEDAIRAMPLIAKEFPEVELLMVGDGAAKTELEKMACSLGVARHVTFTGWKEQKLVKSFMAAADIGVIPHKKTVQWDHTIPHKLFHYMFMELPCIVSNCNPVVRIVTQTNCGAVYTSGSYEELAERAVELLNDDDLRTRYGSAGAHAVQTIYNWDATAIGLIRMYESLLH